MAPSRSPSRSTPWRAGDLLQVVGAAGLTIQVADDGSASWSPQPEVAELYEGLGDVSYFPTGTTGTVSVVVKPATPLASLLPLLRVQESPRIHFQAPLCRRTGRRTAATRT